MRYLENCTQRIFNNSIKQKQKLGSPVNKSVHCREPRFQRPTLASRIQEFRYAYKNDVFRFDIFFYVFKFLENWAWIIISVHFLLRDRCIKQVEIWYFFTLILCFENGIHHCHKKIVTCFTKTLKWLRYDIITKSTNL